MTYVRKIGLLALGAVAIVSGAQAQEAQPGGHAILAISGDPETLNPAASSSALGVDLGCMVYEALVRYGKNFKIEPNLAKSWNISPDGLTYSFELESAKWQDGASFTSRDVQFSLLEVNARFGPLFSAPGALIDKIEVPADDEVIVTLKQPYGPFLASLTCERNGAILPEHLLKGSDIVTSEVSLAKPVGTGPFKLKEWVKGSHLEFEKNPNYWRAGRPYLDGITAKIIPAPGARTLSLRSGEVDYIESYFFPISDYPTLLGDDRYRMIETSFPASDVIILNTQLPPLDKAEVRQALLMAIDRNYLKQAVFFGTGSTGKAAMDSRLTWASDPEIDFDILYPFNADAANAKLDAAGVARDASGKRFSIEVVFDANRADWLQVADALKKYWSDLGVEVQAEGVERAVMLKKVFADYDFGATLQTYDTGGDPAAGVARLYVSSSINAKATFNNAGRYSNAEVDKLFEQGRNGVTLEERGATYKKAAAILAKDLPVLVYHERSYISAASSKLQNIDLSSNLAWWDEVWIKE